VKDTFFNLNFYSSQSVLVFQRSRWKKVFKLKQDKLWGGLQNLKTFYDASLITHNNIADKIVGGPYYNLSSAYIWS